MSKKYLKLAAMCVCCFSTGMPLTARAGNGPFFITYGHQFPEPGEVELMLMNDVGREPDGKSYAAQMLELEIGHTNRWASEIMLEGQKTPGDEYHFTGYRLETRARLFENEVPLNPVLYVEYENLSVKTKYQMEVSGRTDAPESERSREHILETRLILSQPLSPQTTLAFNWINETDLDSDVTAFGYAIGLSYRLASSGEHDHHEGHEGVVLGLELYGGLGDSEKFTADSNITEHYLAPTAMWHLGQGWMFKGGVSVGLTEPSQDLIRMAVGYEF